MRVFRVFGVALGILCFILPQPIKSDTNARGAPIRALQTTAAPAIPQAPQFLLPEQGKPLFDRMREFPGLLSNSSGEQAYGFCKVQDAALLAHGYRMPKKMAHLAVDPAAELA